MTGKQIKEKADKLGISQALYDFQKPLIINMPIGSDFLMLPLSELNLSVRSSNALMRARIDTVQRLVELLADGESIKHIRNLGKKSEREIKTTILEEAYSRLSDSMKLKFCNDFAENNVAEEYSG